MNQRLIDRVLLRWLTVILFAVAGGWKVFCGEAPKPGGEDLKLYKDLKYLTGAIYTADGKHLLFKFKRTATRTNSTMKAVREFTYPDGKVAARERAVYEGDALVSFELEESQIGASGSAKIRRAPDKTAKGSIEFEYRPAGG